MKREKRGSSPLAGLTVAAILLASTAGYMSALSRMFQAPLTPDLTDSDSRFADVADARAAAERAPATFDQSLGRTAPAWLMNALPGYSSGSARIAWYSLLDSSGDRRDFDLSGAGSYTSPNSFLLFDTRSIASTTAVADTRTAGGMAPLAPLASGTWINNGSSSWSITTNWASGVVADGAGNTADFTTVDLSGTRTVTVDTARVIGTINIGDTNGTHGYTIAPGISLTMDGNGSNAQINQTATSFNNTFSVPILLNSSLDITNPSANNLTFSGGISANSAGTKTITTSTGTVIVSGAITNGSGTVAVTQNGPGNLSLTNGANTYSGPTTINGGRITIDSDAEPGTGQLNLSGGTLAVSADHGTSDAITGNVVVTADSTILTTSASTTVNLNFSGTLTGTGGTLTIQNAGADAATDVFAVRFSGGDYTMARPIVLTGGTGVVQLSDFNVSGTTHTYTGVISGDGRYNRSSSTTTGGSTVFTANNTYTGTTVVNVGTLEIANSNSASSGRISGTSSVTVNGNGTLLLSGSSSFTDRINDAAPMTLNGGRFNTGGLSEHGANANDAGIGALTLTASSIIDMGTGASILAFANSSAQSWSGTLSIYNYSGTPYTGNGTDQLYFGNSTSGLTSGQLLQINFYSDNGTTFLGFGGWGTDSDGEVVPVPEPGTWIGAGLALAAIALSQRKRFGKRSRVIG